MRCVKNWGCRSSGVTAAARTSMLDVGCWRVQCWERTRPSGHRLAVSERTAVAPACVVAGFSLRTSHRLKPAATIRWRTFLFLLDDLEDLFAVLGSVDLGVL